MGKRKVIRYLLDRDCVNPATKEEVMDYIDNLIEQNPSTTERLISLHSENELLKLDLIMKNKRFEMYRQLLTNLGVDLKEAESNLPSLNSFPEPPSFIPPNTTLKVETVELRYNICYREYAEEIREKIDKILKGEDKHE